MEAKGWVDAPGDGLAWDFMALFAPIPSIVEQCSGEALEWPRLLDLVAGFAQSGAARAWLRQLRPSCEMAWIEKQHDLTGEMRGLLAAGPVPGLEKVFDPEDLLLEARMEGAALTEPQIFALLRLAESIDAWRLLLQHPPPGAADGIGRLRGLFRLPEGCDLAGLARSLRSRFDPGYDPAADSDAQFPPGHSLLDTASPALRRIRGEIGRRRREIEVNLRATLRRLSQDGETQEDLITIRGERLVIPVRAEHKRRIPGVIHGSSSSGQTVFLEPLETVEQNNELRRVQDEEAAEIRRIFQTMTREIAQQSDALARGAAALAEIDSVAARARFASMLDCVRPGFSDPGAPMLDLARARHPLLEQRLRGAGAIVPLSFALRGEQRQMIVSGPNTGGKTVALKTAGLLAMMAQSGIPVPAAAATFPLFRAFLADIGDAQSIERNLSSFSAHIVNVQSILDALRADALKAKPEEWPSPLPSLVLLDELGSATEPEEGAALAVAIAGYLLERPAWSIITTHYTQLKAYAARRSGAVNAAVGFEESTLTPTYDLRVGLPGSSAGINIAQRLGLEARVIAAARAELAGGNADLSAFLAQLYEQIEGAKREREGLAAQQQAVERERRRLDAQGLDEWRAKTRELERQLESLLKDFSYRLRESLSGAPDGKERQRLADQAGRRVERMRREFTEQFNAAVLAQHSGADKGDLHAEPHLLPRIAIGDAVRLKSLGRNGVVRRLIDEDTFEVSLGQLTMKVSREDVAAAPAEAESPIEAARRRGFSISVVSAAAAAQPEINVIGRTVEEAEAEVEQYLDRAFLAGLAKVRVVHGIGTGRLRSALRSFLRKHPHVATVGEAGPGEGGAGATVVDLRQ